MYKEHLLYNMEREIILIKNIIPFIEEKDLSFRPAEKVRSTYEIMQYLSSIGSNMMHWFLVGMTPEFREKIAAQRNSVTLANFSEQLDNQLQAIKKYMEGVSEEDLLNKIVELPYKEKIPLGSAIINAPIKWLAVYRMELFVYLKLNGNTQISTKEAWVLPETATASNN
jgi:hypothetical protein